MLSSRKNLILYLLVILSFFIVGYYFYNSVSRINNNERTNADNKAYVPNTSLPVDSEPISDIQVGDPVLEIPEKDLELLESNLSDLIKQDSDALVGLAQDYDQDIGDVEARERLSASILKSESYKRNILEKFKLERKQVEE